MDNWDIEGAVEQARRENPTVPPTYIPPRLDLSELRGQLDDVVQERIRAVKEDIQWEMLQYSEELRKYENWDAVERLNQYKRGEKGIQCSTLRVKQLVDEMIQHHLKGMEY